MTLVGEWGFNEGAGTSAADSSGAGHPLTVAAGRWTASSKNGAAAYNQNGVAGGASATFAGPTSAGTIMGWVNQASLPGGTTESLFGYFDVAGGSSQFVIWGQRNDFGTPNVIQVNLRTSGLAECHSPSALPTGAWVHLAATWDGATVTLYVNGSSVATVAKTGTIPAPAYFGVGDPTGVNCHASIDDVRVFDTALAPAAITTYMNTPAGGAATPSVTATYSGTGTATALAFEVERSAAAFSGSGTASATVTATGGTTQVTATFSGAGTAAAALVEIEQAAALFTGAGSAAAAVSASGGTMSVVASFAGSGTASAVVGAAFARTATFSGDGTPWAFVIEVEALSAGFSGTGTAAATVASSGGTAAVAAPFSGAGTASAALFVLATCTATFAGTGTARASVRIGGGGYSVETDVADALADVVQSATGATVTVGAVAPAADGGIALTLSGVGDDARQSMRRLMCQIRIRGAEQDQREPDVLAGAVFDVLHGARELPTAGQSVIAHIYRVSWVSLGRDQNRRWERSDNYYLDLAAPASALLET